MRASDGAPECDIASDRDVAGAASATSVEVVLSGYVDERDSVDDTGSCETGTAGNSLTSKT